MLGQCHSIVQQLCDVPLDPTDYEKLLRVELIKGAQATTAIEGNTLSDEEVKQVADGESLPPSKRYQEIEMRNMLEAMTTLRDEVTQGQTNIIKPELLLRFHEMVGQDLGEYFDAIPGRYRGDERHVGPYKCPPYREVEKLVNDLCSWLGNEFRYPAGQQDFTLGVVEAIVAHVYLEWIHPFGDGNGRTGRMLEFYILLRAGTPDIAAAVLSNHYNLTRPEYYRQLDNASKKNDLTSFLNYAIQGFRDGLQGVLNVVTVGQFRTVWRSYIYDVFSHMTINQAFKRRRQLILEMPLDTALTRDQMVETNANIIKQYANLSTRTIARDIDILIEAELLRKDGKTYIANSEILKQQAPQRLTKPL